LCILFKVEAIVMDSKNVLIIIKNVFVYHWDLPYDSYSNLMISFLAATGQRVSRR
jgi:hypothetical protein